MKTNSYKNWILPFMLFCLFLFIIFDFGFIQNILAIIIKPKNIFIERSSLPEVAFQHIFLVLISSTISIFAGISLAILAHYTKIKEFKEVLIDFANFGETIPTIAILAFSVPFLGYGIKPVLLALIIYGFLPVLRNTLDGFETIPKDIEEAAKGLGMTSIQVLAKVLLPLSLPAIFAGIRASIILNISVATVGALVGVNGFGTLIMNGIRANDSLMILKGALPVTALALAVDSLFIMIGKHFEVRKDI